MYSEGERKLTIPVEMLTKGDYLWEISRASVKVRDAPFAAEKIDSTKAFQILVRVPEFGLREVLVAKEFFSKR